MSNCFELQLCLLSISQLQVSFCRNSSDEQQKVIDTIMEEISIMSKVQHPNLTRCLGVTRHAGHFNIFLEWMAGQELKMYFLNYPTFFLNRRRREIIV